MVVLSYLIYLLRDKISSLSLSLFCLSVLIQIAGAEEVKKIRYLISYLIFYLSFETRTAGAALLP